MECKMNIIIILMIEVRKENNGDKYGKIRGKMHVIPCLVHLCHSIKCESICTNGVPTWGDISAKTFLQPSKHALVTKK